MAGRYDFTDEDPNIWGDMSSESSHSVNNGQADDHGSDRFHVSSRICSSLPSRSSGAWSYHWSGSTTRAKIDEWVDHQECLRLRFPPDVYHMDDIQGEAKSGSMRIDATVVRTRIT